jgi:pimeloyl-ACP methyl ester carboxylesterase
MAIDVPGQPGTRVAVEVHHPQSGRMALLSSGLGLPMTLWHPVVERLAGVRCVLFDRPGLGGSTPWHHEPGLSGQVALLEAVRAAADARGDTPVVLVGHSYAGLHVEAHARRHPDRVAGLVLVDPSLPEHEAATLSLADLSPRLVRRLVARWPWLGRPASRLVAMTGTAGLDPGPAVVASLRAVAESPRHQQGTLDELERIGSEAVELLALVAGVPLPDVEVRLLAATRRPGPLPGDNGRWVAALARRAEELGPRARLVPVRGAHLLMADAPDEVAAQVRQLLEGAASPGV